MAKIGKRKRIRQQLRNRHNTASPKELASCYGKIRMTKEDAFERAAGISTMKAYRCQFGNHYHVGRKSK